MALLTGVQELKKEFSQIRALGPVVGCNGFVPYLWALLFIITHQHEQ